MGVPPAILRGILRDEARQEGGWEETQGNEGKKWRPKEDEGLGEGGRKGRVVRVERKTERKERGKERRAYRSLQTLHGSPPSHNNTTPSPLAATQLPPSPRTRRRRSSLLSTPSPLLVSTLVSTTNLPVPTTTPFLFSGCVRPTTHRSWSPHPR